MKKIKFYNNQFEYLKKALMFLSVTSILFYVLKLFGIDGLDRIFSAVVYITILSAVFINHKSSKKIKIMLLFIAIGIIVYLLFYDKLVIFSADFAKGNTLRFNIINLIYKTLGLNDFENYFDFTGYGGSYFINNQIVNGAVNIFKLNPESKVISQYITTRYLLIYSIFGMSVAVGKDDKFLILTALISVITGNVSLILLSILLFYPLLYLITIVYCFVFAFLSSIVGLKIGFMCSPSLFELIFNNSNIIYSLLICLFVFCLSYYFARLVKEKIV